MAPPACRLWFLLTKFDTYAAIVRARLWPCARVLHNIAGESSVGATARVTPAKMRYRRWRRLSAGRRGVVTPPYEAAAGSLCVVGRHDHMPPHGTRQHYRRRGVGDAAPYGTDTGNCPVIGRDISSYNAHLPRLRYWPFTSWTTPFSTAGAPRRYTAAMLPEVRNLSKGV